MFCLAAATGLAVPLAKRKADGSEERPQSKRMTLDEWQGKNKPSL
jgi:hypothetical protein